MSITRAKQYAIMINHKYVTDIHVVFNVSCEMFTLSKQQYTTLQLIRMMNQLHEAGESTQFIATTKVHVTRDKNAAIVSDDRDEAIDLCMELACMTIDYWSVVDVTEVPRSVFGCRFPT